MIRVKIAIGDNPAQDTLEYGFIYISSDNVVDAPVKEFTKTSYAEEDGEHIYPVVVKNSFDYKVSFFVKGTTTESVNQKIQDFNNSLFETVNGRRESKKVTFHNIHKGVKIVGFAKPINTASQLWKDKLGTQLNGAVVDFSIRVANPQECNFNSYE